MISALIAIGGTATRREFRGFLALATLVGVLQGLALATTVPVLLSLHHDDTGAAWGWLAVLGLVAAAGGTLLTRVTMRGFHLAMNVIVAMHRRLGQRLVELPIGWFTPATTGRTSHVAVRGTMFVAQTAMDILVPLTLHVVTPLTVAVTTCFYDWRMGLALLAAAPVIWLSATLAGRRNGAAERRIHDAASATNSRLLEFADKQLTLRSAGIEGTAYAPLDDAIDEQRRAGRRALWSSVLGLVLQGFVVQAAFGAAVTLGVYLAVRGTADPVHVVALIGLCAQFSGPLKILAELGTALRRSAVEVGAVRDLVELEGLPEPATPSPPPSRHDLVFDNVTFGYGEGLGKDSEPVLNGLSLTVPHHSMVALVGPSGSGKTTLTRLIARFWDVQEGAVTLGGTDVRELATDDLMAQLSLVFQDVYLFDDTLEANIRLGNPGATDEQVRRAAEFAAVTEIAERLPDGWQSTVGEGGRALSGGERQRVSIARALVKNAPVVLFDEATAALDPTTEAVVTESIRLLAGRATVLVIAHSLATVAQADSIAFLDGGVVVEHGTHDDLIARNGRYAQFWRSRESGHHRLDKAGASKGEQP
ncbi:ABC transporter ATP-binding protein [Streptomyces natalensis]|uniref:ABC transporter ATP-binding protein n=1 Tax=Streptomyces natalensis TaxID=68242 RepID=UPI0005CAD8E2|nr:ABC transporter ATP-binding protein [Streptomyces natalensis]